MGLMEELSLIAWVRLQKEEKTRGGTPERWSSVNYHELNLRGARLEYVVESCGRLLSWGTI